MESLKLLISKFKDGTIREIWEEWKWIYGYGKKYKLEIAFYVFLGVFGSIMSLVSSVASKNLINIVTGEMRSKILPMALLMVSMALFNLLFGSWSSRVSLKINIRIQNDIQADIFDKIINVNWLDISKYHSGDILNRFSSDVGTVASSAIGWFPTLITTGFSFISSLLLIMYYDPMMGVIAMINAPVMLLSSKILLSRMRKYNKKVKEMNSEVLAFQEETFHNMDTIKSFGITDIFSGKLRVFQKRFKDVNLEYNMFSIKTNIILSIIGMCVQYMCFGWGIYRLWSGMINYGEMTLFLSQASKLSGDFSSLVKIFPSTISATISAGRIMELINLPRERNEMEKQEQFENAVKDGFAIRLRDVFFAYEQGKDILTSSDFKANPNEIVALVGPSGEGKTTMIRMFLGLIFPDMGQAVMIDKDSNEVELNAATRHYFAYVPQGNTLFSGTIADNLRLVKPKATDEEIIEALKISCAYDFVSKKQKGIYEEIGERGRGLSEGQAQRIAIARAVICDAPILLLDEATSALDVQTERMVLNNIIKQRPNKTCIVTTHRPSVLKMCQRVYRVMNTRVTELDSEESSRMSVDF